MKDFIAFLRIELKKLLSRKLLIVALIILAILLGFVQYHVSVYKNSLAKKAIFQEIEMKKIKLYQDYRKYASFGFRIISLPDPLSILFTNASGIQNTTSFIDAGDRLNIDMSLKGSAAFKIDRNWFADFSGLLLFFGSLIALTYGLSAFSNKDYDRFLSSIIGEKKVFFSILLARAIILAIFFLLVIAAALLVIQINGISIVIDWHLLLFFIMLYGVVLFFLVLGSLFGLYKSLLIGLAWGFATWFLLLIIVPFIISIIVSIQADEIKPETQLDLEKLTLLQDFERRADEKAGVLKLNKQPENVHRELVRDYHQNEFPHMQALEEELRVQMQELAKLYYMLSSVFPTTGYLAFTNEISSKGYKELDASYGHLIQIKEAFFKEYIGKVYFSSQPEKIKVEPFLKGDENIFKGKPALPDYYLLGIFFNLLWIAAFLIPSYFRFKKNLFELPEKKKAEIEPDDVQLKEIDFKAWRINSNTLSSLFYNLLSNATREINKKGFTFKVTIENLLLNTARKGQNFLYLCQLSKLPGDMKTGMIVDQLMGVMNVDRAKRKEIKARFSLDALKNKKLDQLETSECGQVYLAILEMKKFHIYLIDNITNGMPLDFCIALRQKLIDLFDAGSIVLLLSSEENYLINGKDRIRAATEIKWLRRIGDLMAQEAEKSCADNDELQDDEVNN